MFVAQANGGEVVDDRGHGGADGTLHPLQEAFREHHGLQCGFCTPGMITRAWRLLQENPDPSEEEIRYGISGNLCRCTGYQNIVKAVRAAADQLAAREGGRGMNEPDAELRPSAPRSWRAWAARASASRTPASPRARATMSTT